MRRRLAHWFARPAAKAADAAPDAAAPIAAASGAASSGAELEAALAARPDDASLNYRVGLAHLEQGDAVGALDYFHLALHYAPELFPACAARVRALERAGRSAEAAAAYREFLAANPGHAAASYALAHWHYERGDYDAAIALLTPLAATPSRERDACNLLGLILGREMGEFDRGERYLRRALALEPDWPVALANLGWILAEKGDYAQGFELLDAVLARHPQDHETRLIRSYMNLKRGAFGEGWRDFEARRQSRFALAQAEPRAPWDGAPIPGKSLLVTAEQGLGDQIMFASCFGEAIGRVGRCVIESDPRLVALFQRSFPAASVVARNSDSRADATAEAGAADYQIGMGSLPRLFRQRWADFPRHSGYVRAAPERVEYWRRRLAALGSGPKVGLSWRGGVSATRRHLRSLAPLDLLPLLRLPARFVSLQYGDCAADLELLQREHGTVLPHWPDALEDYDETAGLVGALDLVVSVCTAVIHLSGALGKPVWVLVPRIAEWRYLDSGSELPWYPSAVLFRQAGHGNWDQPLAAVIRRFGEMFGPTTATK